MNKKVRPQHPKSATEIARQSAPAKMRQIQSRSRQLDQEIHRLECSIAAAPRAQRQHRLATRDTLPPPEPTFSKARRATKRQTLHQQHQQQRKLRGLIIELATVLTLLAAALGWMNQWFHWWD